MPEFGWIRLAYLLSVLSMLAVLVRLGGLVTDSSPVIAESPDWARAIFLQDSALSSRDSVPSSRDSAVSRRDRSVPEMRHEMAGSPVQASQTRIKVRARHRHETSKESSGVYENVDFSEEPPVFYRPVPRPPATGSGGVRPGADAVCKTVGEVPRGSEIVFPLSKTYYDSYEDTWGAPRPQGGHEGTDLMVPAGTPLYAITDARVVPVSGANGNGWNTLGGYTVMLEAAHDMGPVAKGDLFYYAHMDAKSALEIGDVVEAGDVVGYAGDTGEGPEGTRGHFPPHLHLGWYDTSGARTDLASGAMNPYPLLEWIKANGGGISADDSGARYCEAPQTGAPTPSTGESYWQFPSSPGVRPDIDTGSGNPSPSPVVGTQSRSAEHDPGLEREPELQRRVHPPEEKPRGRGEPDGSRREKPPNADAPGGPDRRPPGGGPEAGREGGGDNPWASAKRIRDLVMEIIDRSVPRATPDTRRDAKPAKPAEKRPEARPAEKRPEARPGEKRPDTSQPAAKAPKHPDTPEPPDSTSPEGGSPESPDGQRPGSSPGCRDTETAQQYCEAGAPVAAEPPEGEETGAGGESTAAPEPEREAAGSSGEAEQQTLSPPAVPENGGSATEEPVPETAPPAPENTTSD